MWQFTECFPSEQLQCPLSETRCTLVQHSVVAVFQALQTFVFPSFWYKFYLVFICLKNLIPELGWLFFLANSNLKIQECYQWFASCSKPSVYIKRRSWGCLLDLDFLWMQYLQNTFRYFLQNLQKCPYWDEMIMILTVRCQSSRSLPLHGVDPCECEKKKILRSNPLTIACSNFGGQRSYIYG